MASRSCLEKMRKIHDSLAERIYENPGIIIIDGDIVSEETLISKRREFWCGYCTDIAFLREPQPATAEFDIIEVCSNCYGKSITGAYSDLKNKTLCFCENYFPLFLKKLKYGMGFKPQNYTELWLDILVSFFDFNGAVKTERLPGFRKKLIARIH
ncbi:MAG: hypothetical protein QXN71_01490 [Candidatus Aenigmatarchaeota archaeon]